MPTPQQSQFLVCTREDPIVLRVCGKASYLNCGCVGDFFDHLIADGHRDFVVDFAKCSGMDSTFLGLLASAGLRLREFDPPGKLVLVRLNQRNQELVRNLGLQHIMIIDPGTRGSEVEQDPPPNSGAEDAMEEERQADLKLILRAHEALGEVDESNKRRFQDVIAFLQREVDGS